MTTKWAVPALWPGETAAVLAGAPSLTPELARSVQHLPRIVVKRAFKLSPDADMLVSIDGSAHAEFWAEAASFAGIKVCGVECELDAFYLPMPYEHVVIAPGHEIHFRNNMLSAIRIAAAAGAKKILLLGCDTERYERLCNFVGLTAGLAALVDEFTTRGVQLEQVG